MPLSPLLFLSDGGSTGSGNGNDGSLSPAPPFTVQWLFVIVLAYEIGVAFLLAIFWWMLPARLLGPICVRVFACEAIQECVMLQEAGGGGEGDSGTRAADEVDVESPVTMGTPLMEAQVQQRNSASSSSSYAAADSSSSEHVTASLAVPTNSLSQRMVTKTVGTKIRVMGMVVRLDARDSSDPLSHRGGGGGCVSFLRALMPSTCMRRPLSVRVVRLLRRICWFHSWVALIYLLEVSVYSLSKFHVPDSDIESACPPRTAGRFCYDDAAVYVDCYEAGSISVPPHVTQLTCYRVIDADSTALVAAFSSAASLFLLVFSSIAVASGMLLQQITSRRKLYAGGVAWTALITVIFIVAFMGSSGDYALSIFVPMVAAYTPITLLRIRLMQLEYGQKHRIDDGVADWIKRVLGCGGAA